MSWLRKFFVLFSLLCVYTVPTVGYAEKVYLMTETELKQLNNKLIQLQTNNKYCEMKLEERSKSYNEAMLTLETQYKKTSESLDRANKYLKEYQSESKKKLNESKARVVGLCGVLLVSLVALAKK